MSIKYALTLSSVGMLSIPDADSIRAVAHVPLDEFILTALTRSRCAIPCCYPTRNLCNWMVS